MTANAFHEHFIPLYHNDLIELLCKDIELGPAERDLFRRFCRLVSAVYRYEFYQRLTELKPSYAPFDPDSDKKPLEHQSSEDEQKCLNDLSCDFGWLLDRADFKHLSREDFEPSLAERNSLGL